MNISHRMIRDCQVVFRLQLRVVSICPSVGFSSVRLGFSRVCSKE